MLRPIVLRIAWSSSSAPAAIARSCVSLIGRSQLKEKFGIRSLKASGRTGNHQCCNHVSRLSSFRVSIFTASPITIDVGYRGISPNDFLNCSSCERKSGSSNNCEAATPILPSIGERRLLRRNPKTYLACSCASNSTFRVISSNRPVVDFGFRSDPSIGVAVSVGGLYATGFGRSSPDISSVSSISSEFRTMPVDRSWMRLFRLSIFFGLGGGV